MSATESPMMKAALRCVERGWYVFPLAERGKQPDGEFAPHGFQSASNDPNVVRGWWTKKPFANIGVDLGRSNLTVLDFDKGTPPVELNLPQTLQVSTSRGTHVYFAGTSKQGDMYWNGTQLGEIKSAGGYVLTVSSVHPDGPVYNLAVAAPVASIPEGLIERLRPTKPAVDASLNGGKIPYGQHDNTLRDIARKLRGIGLEEDAIFDALVEICEKRCEGYGSDYLDMCRKHAHTVAEKFEPNPVGRALTLSGQTPDDPANPTKVVSESELDAAFPFYDGTESADLPMLIEGFMPEGVTFFGSLSGTGKTWVGLSIAKALTTGNPLWSVFPVVEKTGVLFLIPETSDGAFTRRLKKLGITQDKTRFRYRTITQGMAVPLRDPATVAAVKYLQGHNRKVLVIVDTAVRFLSGADENSAKENTLVLDSDVLRSIGASILFQHHAPKATKDAAELTLENVLRGTGDFGAMSDAVYGLRRDEKLFAYNQGPEQIDVVCVKPRDFDPPAPFRLELKRKPLPGDIVGDKQNVSVIDEIGDLNYIGSQTLKNEAKAKLATIFSQNPYISFNSLVDDLKMNRTLVKDFVFANGGWKQVFVREPNAKGLMVPRRKWKTGLLMGGETLADESAVPTAAIPGKVVEFHHPAKVDPNTATGHPVEDPAQGF